MAVTIVDYGMGNLRSVAKAVESLDVAVQVSDRPGDIERAGQLIVPGVGACGQAMDELRRRGLMGPLLAYLADDRPYLGICLGLQLLFEHSEEGGGVAGLGVLPGRVVRFQPGSDRHVKVPHMGWNTIVPSNGHQVPLLHGVPAGSYVYFVHSYYVEPTAPEIVATWTEYAGVRFASSICFGRRHATQFHPEKSQRVGRRVLDNFLRTTAAR